MMASGAQTLIVLPVTMWRKGIKINNFVCNDCLSTLFTYRLHYIKCALPLLAINHVRVHTHP